MSWRDSPKVKVMGAQRYSAQDHEGELQVYVRVGLAGPCRPELCDILCVLGAGVIRIKSTPVKMSKCYVCLELEDTVDIAGEYLDYSFIWKGGICISLFQSQCPNRYF